jgi:hypothetical protein
MVDDPGSRTRFRRFEFRRPERQLDIPRILLAGLLLPAMLSMLGYLALQTARSAVRWLHQQPQYQVAFLDIKLRPVPPAWFRGGSEGFLKQVRERSKEAEVLSVLDLDSGRLQRDFKDYSPWVEEVLRIEYPPQTIVVDLVYKQPVALIDPSSAGDVILDHNGHLLPFDDLDQEKLGPLIRITGQQLVPSPENRPGGIWKSGLSSLEAARIERAIRGACGLAGYFQEPERSSEGLSNPALHVRSIYATDPRGLFVRTEEDVQILWGEPPGEESFGRLDASKKWEIMKKWANSTPRRRLASGGYWMFTKIDLRPVEPLGSRS